MEGRPKLDTNSEPYADTVAMTRIIAHRPDGSEIDVTSEVGLVYRLLNESMDYGSGFLSIEDVTEITRLALACGFASNEEADQQLRAYVRTLTSSCPRCRAWVKDMEWTEATATGRILRLQPCGHEMELSTPPGEPAGLRPHPAQIDGSGGGSDA